MRHYLLAAVLLILFVPRAYSQDNNEQHKLAQTGMKFLSLSVDPRAAALADAMTAVEGYSTSLFYNPAAMAHQPAVLEMAVAQTQWITDIRYNLASLSFSPAHGRYGVLGLSILSVDYPEQQETIYYGGNDQGYLDLGTFAPSDLALGLGYAKAVTDRFSVGGQVKLAHQDLGSSVMVAGQSADGTQYKRQDNAKSVLAYDFGVMYKTGFRSLTFAVAARNFAPEITYENESFQLPLTFRIGLAMDLLDLTSLSDNNALRLSVDAEHPRDYSEMIRIGGEYEFMHVFALRAGYVFPTDEQGINLGVGFHPNLGPVRLAADYAYTDMGTFNSFSRVHRIALHLSFQ